MNDGGEHAGRTPWWLRGPARLTAWLALLVLLALGLLGSHSSLFSSRHAPSAELLSCVPRADLKQAAVDIHGLATLRRTIVPVMRPLSRGQSSFGPIGPTVAWTDDLAQGFRSVHPPNGRWSAGWEMARWTDAGNLVVADALLFAGEEHAEAFFDDAASPRCHRAGAAQAAAFPYGARQLSWINPDGAGEQDVFLRAGPIVYRVLIVMPSAMAAHAVGVRRGFAIVEALACRLPGATCPAGTAVPGGV